MKLRKRIRRMLAGPRLYRALVDEKTWYQSISQNFNPAFRVEINQQLFRERIVAIQEVLRRL